MILFVCSLLGILLYGAAGAVGLYGVVRDRARAVRAGKVLFFVAVLAHTALIGCESMRTSGTLLSGPNIVMLASWVLAVVTAIGVAVTRRGMSIAAVACLVIAVLIAVAVWMRILDPLDADNMAFYQWPLLLPHIVLVFLACAFFATSAVASGVQLYQQHLVRQRSAKVLSLDAPSLDTLGKIARLTALAGLVVFTAAILIGITHLVAIYAAMVNAGCAGNLSYLIPRMVLSGAVWLVWAAYAIFAFLVPYVVGSRARAWLAIAGCALALALIAVSAG
ncbi:hypothetical protein [uncultured Adlercreutzia sp.]|uniref:hypothetical protein n=1 Tax=uncultured Adlercreutzia sp. TaxID=875803 RepID=UPI0025F69668|nr:hypothetical protein [uncultured Adlercreutzia sp.]MCI9262591.1 hypothetical protein [Eggerthellaceae bacterium]